MTTTRPRSQPGPGTCPRPGPPGSAGSTTAAGPACWTCTSAARTSWDATKRIDWSIPVDPTNVMEQSEELNPIYGSAQWEKLSEKERDELGHHLSAWLFSQFLHGEQGALTVAARIVDSVPDM